MAAAAPSHQPASPPWPSSPNETPQDVSVGNRPSPLQADPSPPQPENRSPDRPDPDRSPCSPGKPPAHASNPVSAALLHASAAWRCTRPAPLPRPSPHTSVATSYSVPADSHAAPSRSTNPPFAKREGSKRNPLWFQHNQNSSRLWPDRPLPHSIPARPSPFVHPWL